MKVTKEIKNAVQQVLAWRIDRANYGMLSTMRIPWESQHLLSVNHITITPNMSMHDDIVHHGCVTIGKVYYRYATRKRDGMYKMLKPKVEWL